MLYTLNICHLYLKINKNKEVGKKRFQVKTLVIICLTDFSRRQNVRSKCFTEVTKLTSEQTTGIWRNRCSGVREWSQGINGYWVKRDGNSFGLNWTAAAQAEREAQPLREAAGPSGGPRRLTRPGYRGHQIAASLTCIFRDPGSAYTWVQVTKVEISLF